LYGRVAIGYAVLLPVLLVAQAAAVIALANQRDRTHSTERLERAQVARHLALLLSQRLEQTPHAPLADLVIGLQPSARLFVVMKNGTVLENRSPGQDTIDEFVDGLPRIDGVASFPEAWSGSDFGATPLLVDGKVVGLVGITPRTMFERYGGVMLAWGTGLLFIGNLALALLVIKPIRSKLGGLRSAAARLRDGDLSARAGASGTDELAELARVFNEMATQLTRRTSELETSDRLRRQLVADVSHELMTPLTSVLARLETLAMDDVELTDEQRAAQVARATSEARRLERLIGDLLASVRLESGATALARDEIQIADLFAEVIARHEGECRRRGIMVGQDVRIDRVIGDRFRLDQAIDNLVANAIRHAPTGGRIELQAWQVSASVRMTVWDSAGAIAPAHLPHLFDRFYKVESVNGIASPGSGLGLSIVKAIVERHGGAVFAESSPADGTTFTIELPLETAADKRRTASAPAKA
jgi:signal transduction histidine kinase